MRKTQQDKPPHSRPASLAYEYHIDDGYADRNFKRPSFQRMIADIEVGKVAGNAFW